MRSYLLAALIGLCSTVPGRPAEQQKQKEEEPPTQVLEALKEPPPAVTADTNRLVFYLSPLSSRGLLSQQVRDGLKALLAQAGSAQIVKLRAFVAGSGDTRRVQAIVSEIYTARRQALPALTVIQVGALPMAGVQIVMEATAVSRRVVNQHGLAFLAAQSSETTGLPGKLAPLAKQTVPKLRGALAAAGLEGRDVMFATCFVSAVDDIWDVRTLFATEFPKAPVNMVQLERAPSRGVAGCEAVARLRTPPGAPVKFVKAKEPAGSQSTGVALVGAAKLVFSSGQMAFGYRGEDARLAFQRLAKTLEQGRGSLATAAVLSYYVLSRPVAEQARKVAAEFLDGSAQPAATVMPCVGLPSLDASFAVDVIAVADNTR